MSREAAHTIALAQSPGMKGGIVKRSVKEMISEKLASVIASGALQIGDELPSERELALALSVSRESVRGAVQELASRGLVEISHGARTRVVSTEGATLKTGIASPEVINRYDLESVHKARLLVERAVVADAATAIDAPTLRRLEASLAAQRECLDDPVRFLIADREFHLAIYRCASNALLSDLVTALYTYMMEYRRMAMAQPGAILRSYKEHIAIMAALEARNAARAVDAFDRHIERIYTTTRSILENAGKGEPASAGNRRSRRNQTSARIGPDSRRRGRTPSDGS
jgi:DNA-binding FadR family transcriptional regulator